MNTSPFPRNVCRTCSRADCRYHSHVYFARDEGDSLIKIGHTHYLTRRLRALTRGTEGNKPVTLLRLVGLIPGDLEVETKILKMFRHARIDGLPGDWHEATPGLLTFIQEHASEPIKQMRKEQTRQHSILKVYTMNAVELRERSLRDAEARWRRRDAR